MKKRNWILFCIGFLIGSPAYCINHNELKYLRILSGQQNPYRVVLRSVDQGFVEQLAQENTMLQQELDEAREFLEELADFAEDNI